MNRFLKQKYELKCKVIEYKIQQCLKKIATDIKYIWYTYVWYTYNMV